MSIKGATIDLDKQCLCPSEFLDLCEIWEFKGINLPPNYLIPAPSIRMNEQDAKLGSSNAAYQFAQCVCTEHAILK